MHISKLLLWHGRMSYKRSAIQVQYIIYRGMLIGAMHAAFIATFSFVSIALFHSTLQAGYTTFFTFLPTFAIVLDEDVSVKYL
jgi:phospholipid-translocating ATPase